MKETIQRPGDMTEPGRSFLKLHIQEDGDIVVTVLGVNWAGNDSVASVEFCQQFSGGGRSPRTLAALRGLASAMQADNAERPLA